MMDTTPGHAPWEAPLRLTALSRPIAPAKRRVGNVQRAAALTARDCLPPGRSQQLLR